MIIKNDEHICIFGMTGSGKTTFCKKLYSGIEAGHIVILDLKHDIDDLPNAVIMSDCNLIVEYLKNGSNVIFRPIGTDKKILDDVADIVFKRGNTILILDESVEIIPEGGLTDAYKRIFVRGRSRRAVCWVLSQRPALISKTAMSQAVHTFCFALMQAHDKKSISNNIPLDVNDFGKLKMYDFFHFRQGDTVVSIHRS